MAGRFRTLTLLGTLALCATRAGAMVLTGPPSGLPSQASDIEVHGGIAYLTTLSGLILLDVSLPGEAPAPLGSLTGDAFVASELEVHGDLVYLASGYAGLHIVDVSDPENPVPRGELSLGTAISLEIAGTLAYVVTDDASNWLRIVDVSDPSLPIEVGALELDPGVGREIAVAAGVAYVGGDFSGFMIIDVTDPSAPSRIGAVALHRIDDLEVSGGELYIAGQEDLSIFDLADPRAPQLVTTLENYIAQDVEVLGDLLYASDNLRAEFRVLDVSDPAIPRELGVLTTGRVGYRSHAISDGCAFIVAGIGASPEPWQLWTVDLKVPEYPRRTFLEGSLQRLRLLGDRLYAGQSSLTVFDTSDPLAPVPLGSSPFLGLVSDIEVGNEVAFVAISSGLSDMAFVDVSDPALPAPIPGPAIRASSLALRGDRLYVGTRSAVLEIYDISDAANPLPIASTSLRPGSSRPTDLDLDGSRLYVTTQFGIEIFDVSIDSAPTRIGVIEGRPLVFESAPHGKLLFSSAPIGFLVTDVSDPSAPVVSGPFGSTALQAEIEVVADRLFVGSVPSVFDISDPLAPRLLGGSGTGSQIETAGDVVYTTGTGSGGLYAIDFGPEYAPTLEVRIDISPLDPRNRVVITRPGLLMLGLFGSPALDVRDVDPGSLAFGPLGAPAIRTLPLRLDRDADKDLLSIHRTAEAGIAIGDTEACLSGATWEGRRFRGCDAIQPLAGCGDGYALALLVPLLVPLRRAFRGRSV